MSIRSAIRRGNSTSLSQICCRSRPTVLTGVSILALTSPQLQAPITSPVNRAGCSTLRTSAELGMNERRLRLAAIIPGHPVNAQRHGPAEVWALALRGSGCRPDGLENGQSGSTTASCNTSRLGHGLKIRRAPIPTRASSYGSRTFGVRHEGTRARRRAASRSGKIS